MVTVIWIFGTLVIVALFIVAVIVMLMMVVLIPRPFKTTGFRLAEVYVGWLTTVYPTVLFNGFRFPCEVVQLEADFRPPAMVFIYLFRGLDILAGNCPSQVG